MTARHPHGLVKAQSTGDADVELAIYELARIMSGADYDTSSPAGCEALRIGGLAEFVGVADAIIITDAGQAVWCDLVTRMVEGLK